MFPFTFDPMLLLAIAAFGFGLSLATYRWFANHNVWPMGEWQAHRPGLPIAIGLFAMLFAMLFAIARGDGATLLAVPFFGVLSGLLWTWMTRVGSQSSLLLAPASVLWLLGYWIVAANSLERGASLPRVERTSAPVILEPAGPSQPQFGQLPQPAPGQFGPAQQPPQVVQPVQVQPVAPPAWLDRERQPAIQVERDRLPPAQVDRNRVSPPQR